MTIDQMKILLGNPLFLLFVMLVGGLCSIVNQVTNGRRNDPGLTYSDYFQHWPELLAALGGLLVAFVGMVESNTLNVVSAWGLGFASNSLAGKIRHEGGRTEAMAVSAAPPFPPAQRVDER